VKDKFIRVPHNGFILNILLTLILLEVAIKECFDFLIFNFCSFQHFQFHHCQQRIVVWFVHFLYLLYDTLNCCIKFGTKAEGFVEVQNINGEAPLSELIVREFRGLKALHFEEEVWLSLIHLDVVGLLIH